MCERPPSAQPAYPEQTLGGVSEATQQKVLHNHAAAFYRIPQPRRQGIH